MADTRILAVFGGPALGSLGMNEEGIEVTGDDPQAFASLYILRVELTVNFGRLYTYSVRAQIQTPIRGERKARSDVH